MNAKDLNYFKERLLARRRELVALVQKTESYGRELDAEDQAMDIADKASSSYTKEFMFSKSNVDRQILQMISDALDRIEKSGYGHCISCDRAIDRRRLEAVPWAEYCLKCQELQEEGLL